MSIWFYLLFVAFFGCISLAFKVDDIIHERRYGKSGRISSYYDDDTTFPGFCIGFAAVVGLVCAIIFGVPRTNFNEIEYQYKSTNIESITLNSNTTGELHMAFTIGTGYIEETPVYYFYEHSDLGGMKLSSVSANHSILIETDDEVPHIEMVDKIKFKNPNFIASLFRTKRRLNHLEIEGEDYYNNRRRPDGTIMWQDVHYNEHAIIKIYVPKNTIKRQFSVDTMNL